VTVNPEVLRAYCEQNANKKGLRPLFLRKLAHKTAAFGPICVVTLKRKKGGEGRKTMPGPRTFSGWL